jgi:hypothetical protein
MCTYRAKTRISSIPGKENPKTIIIAIAGGSNFRIPMKAQAGYSSIAAMKM